MGDTKTYGKGSKPRPYSNYKNWSNNWDLVFKRKSKNDKIDKKEISKKSCATDYRKERDGSKIGKSDDSGDETY